MANLNQLVQSLVTQGSQKEGAVVLPHWIQEGARLSYVSERSGKALDVVVEGISHSKQQVRFVFAADKKSWKSVTFSQIIAGRNPLRKREPTEKVAAAPATAAEEGEKDEAEKALDSLEEKWSTADAAREKRKRGLTPATGPSRNTVPNAWERPEILDIDSSPERAAPSEVEDLDAEAPPPAPADPDPYGLGEPALAAEEAARAAAREASQGRGREERARSRRRARSASGGRRRRGKDAEGKDGNGRRGRERSRSRKKAERSRSRKKAERSRSRKKAERSRSRKKAVRSRSRRKARSRSRRRSSSEKRP